MTDPTVERVKLINEADFRLVRLDMDGQIEHVLEVRDTPDAMGSERWRRFEINGVAMKAMFRYLIRIAEKEADAKN